MHYPFLSKSARASSFSVDPIDEQGIFQPSPKAGGYPPTFDIDEREFLTIMTLDTVAKAYFKLKRWQGFQAVFARKGAWMLGFSAFALLSASGYAYAEPPTIRFRVVITALAPDTPAYLNDVTVAPGADFQFDLPSTEPIRFICSAKKIIGNRARVNCIAGPVLRGQWRESFMVEPLIGKCVDTSFVAPVARKVSLAICTSLDMFQKREYPS